ncbi:hypothetical protein GCM10007304_26140 [Rhodococcoides trifolii]|uniref:Uncharacterized protein n=1 Tax=Rhodococcoides trifolii TaxID=908250 RepID=A0A917D3D1_9NOCA|nr:hypothetical protein GCM10007304_26140 [Rhodococcus trifolii]
MDVVEEIVVSALVNAVVPLGLQARREAATFYGRVRETSQGTLHLVIDAQAVLGRKWKVSQHCSTDWAQRVMCHIEKWTVRL